MYQLIRKIGVNMIYVKYEVDEFKDSTTIQYQEKNSIIYGRNIFEIRIQI